MSSDSSRGSGEGPPTWSSQETATVRAADKRFVWHPFTQMRDWCDPGHDPVVIVGGRGAVLWDSEGNEFLDGNASIWTNVHGHGHPTIVGAIQRQAAQLAHASFLGTTNPVAASLAERLVGLFPVGTLERVFFSDDGSTAVECAAKMAIQFRQLTGEPERTRFAAFGGAYHGDTAGAASFGGIPVFNERFARFGYPVHHVADLAGLEALPEPVAAVLIEPLVQGAAGIRCWPAGMLRGLRDWCDRTGTHLICDEVMTGFGRIGTMFACQQEGVVPDFLALGKGLTGGTMPLAATLTTGQVFEAFLGGFEEAKTFFYGHSYAGNPLGCAAALANLQVFEDEQTLDSLPGKIECLAGHLETLASSCPAVHEVRQCGLVAGIELAPGDWRERRGARVCEAARTFGLLTRPVVDTIVLLPPLCITPDQIAAAVEAVRRAIGEVLPG